MPSESAATETQRIIAEELERNFGRLFAWQADRIIEAPPQPCGSCQVGYHGLCEAPASALGGRCDCRVVGVDHDPDWDALRAELDDD